MTAATEEESTTPILEQWLPQMDDNWRAILDYQGDFLLIYINQLVKNLFSKGFNTDFSLNIHLFIVSLKYLGEGR